VAALAPFRCLVAALAMSWAVACPAQPTPAASPFSLVFANEIGEGAFRSALARSLTDQLFAARGPDRSAPEGWVTVLGVRSLAERSGAGGNVTVEAVVSVSVMDTAGGGVRLARVVRTVYPASAPDALERLGEITGRRIARAVCGVSSCGMPQRPAPAPSRRIIKESDW
jgi:hypothetical protein